MVVKDVPPYVLASGQSAKPHGINSEGLKRRGFSSEDILAIKRAYKELYRKGHSVEQALENIPDISPALIDFKQFIVNSPRGIIR